MAARSGVTRAVLAIAATYIYFLLYAQFAFLALLRTRLDEAEIERMMISMGLTGLVTSLATAVALKRLSPRFLLLFGFAGAGGTALLALAVHGSAAFLIIAALIGFFTAVLTVTLAARLRDLAPGHGVAWTAGLGTGLAYLFCNVPAVFAGSPVVQSWISAAVCGIGLVAVSSVPESAARESAGTPATPSRWAVVQLLRKLVTRDGVLRAVLKLASLKQLRSVLGHHPWSRAYGCAALGAEDFRGWGFVSIVLAFLALIWLDSAAFAIIQETATLKGTTWGSSTQKLVQGGFHAVAAVAAGMLIDRGFFRSLLLATYGLFAVAFTLLAASPGDTLVAGPLYGIGIATYSCALVVYPSYHGDGPGLVPRRFRAGWLYGVAGWIGSALGVGMAQSQHHIPRFFLAAAGIVLLLSAGFGQLERLKRLARIHAVTLIGALAGIVFFSVAGSSSPSPTSLQTSQADPHPLTPSPWLERGNRNEMDPAVTTNGGVAGPPRTKRKLSERDTSIADTASLESEDGGESSVARVLRLRPRGPGNPGLRGTAERLIARGRQVYIHEGCIHCHSQYVRPHGPDVALWGPPRDGHGETPPLYGNRRQGPDLSHAGNRRSSVWHRLHLIAPRAFMPSSRMPSYAHLFMDDNPAGEELVAYLASLGTSQQSAWYEAVRQAPIAAAAHGGDPARGARLFQRYCAICHGADGVGDGPMAPALYRPAMNLRKGALWLVSWEEGELGARAEGLARLIRYGMPGTSMPGHETLADRQIADLVAFVEQLLANPLPSPTIDDTVEDATS